MPLELQQEMDGKLLAVRLTGTLQKDDYKHFLPTVERAIQKHGKLRILVEMHDFHGWALGALWEDIKFDVKHYKDIERLAMVGDKKWEQRMATFCKPFTTAKIKYFPQGQSAEARAWIAAE